MEAAKREGKGQLKGLNNIEGEIVDFKIHMRNEYEAVCSRIRQKQELSIDVGYVLIRELLGNVDRIAEDVQKMVNMTQCSHFQETTANRVKPTEDV